MWTSPMKLKWLLMWLLFGFIKGEDPGKRLFLAFGEGKSYSGFLVAVIGCSQHPDSFQQRKDVKELKEFIILRKREKWVLCPQTGNWQKIQSFRGYFLSD